MNLPPRKRLLLALTVVTVAVAVTAAIVLKDPLLEWGLVRTLETGELSQKQAAARWLADLRAVSSVPAIVEQAQKTDGFRWTAFRSIARMGPEGKKRLLELVKHPDDDFRSAVVEALVDQERPLDRKTLSAFFEALKDEPDDVRRRSSAALADYVRGINPDSASPERLDAEDDWERYAALARFGAARRVGGASVLRRFLDDPNPLIRSQAASLLSVYGSSGRSAVPELVRVIEQSSGSERLVAVRTLADVAPEDPILVGPATEWLSDRDMQVRVLAAQILEAIGSVAESAVPDLVRSLKDTEPSVRAAAASALAGIGAAGETVVPELLAALGDPEADVRVSVVAAIGTLASSPNRCVPELLKAAGDNDWRVRHIALEGLVALDAGRADVVKKLIECLGDSDDDVRFVAIEGLIHAGRAAKSALPELLRRARDPGDPLHAQAIVALGSVGAESGETVVAVGTALEKLDPGDVSPKSAIVKTLGELGPQAAPWLPAILEDLDSVDRDSELGREIIRTLGRLGPQAQASVPRLLHKLEEKDVVSAPLDVWGWPSTVNAVGLFDTGLPVDASAQIDVIRALGEIAGATEVVVPRLGSILESRTSSPEKRVETLRALAKFGPDAASAEPAIAAHLADPAFDVRRAACEALGEIGFVSPAAVAAVAERLGDDDRRVRTAAARALGEIGGREGTEVEAIVRALKDPHWHVRYRAAVALRRLSLERAIPALKTLSNDPHPAVRRAAAEVR